MTDTNEDIMELLKRKKEKKEKKKKKKEKKKKKKKKREREETDESETPTSPVAKKAKIEDPVPTTRRVRTRSMDAKEDENGNPPLSKFRISSPLQSLLMAKGITHLFPIQSMTYDAIYDGKDVIGRARTGQGKTLAFSLPIIEKLRSTKRTKARGRSPAVIIMAPTRELAKQVGEDFDYCSPELECICVYGGTGYGDQTRAFYRGVDVVIGTPGRIIDHIERGSLDLSAVQYFVLDEADRMLDMGFQEDMDKVFSAVKAGESNRKLQTLLFSATVPSWVKSVANKYMADDRVTIDLVEGKKMQASVDVTHFKCRCSWQVESRASMIYDLIRVYATGVVTGEARCIVFVQTKREANELIVAKSMKLQCRAMHGDIPQATRESTLKAFRDGKFSVLVATDVAARGIHIDNIDLVVNCEPPYLGRTSNNRRADVDTYVHRSGRTGRAGRKGCCITLFTHRQEELLNHIEKKIGNSMKRIGPPQPSELLGSLVKGVTKKVLTVPDSVVKMLRPHASKFLLDNDIVLEEESSSTKDKLEELVAKALAGLTGHYNAADLAGRSLLSSEINFTTFAFRSRSDFTHAGYVWTPLRRDFDEDVKESIRGMRLTADGHGAVFDVPNEHAEKFRARCVPEEEVESKWTCFYEPSTLPKLKETVSRSSFGGGRGRSSSGGRGRSGRGRGGRGRGGRGRGGRGRGGRGGRGRQRW